ncbi:MAG: guanine deaminase, partial [Chloroflexota bacterium]
KLEPALCQTPSQAYESSRALIERWHGDGRIRYAVTPRYALSTSLEMLEVARTLLREKPGLVLQTHLSEALDEIAAVKMRFPWATDYLEVYEAFDLVGPHSVFAHDVHPTAAEVKRLAQAHASVAHCPTSNAFLGSGLFPMAAHCAQRVDVALGSDVGAGTGFSLFKEGLMAYQMQMLRPDGYPLNPAHLLYLCTLAGARAMGVDAEVGDLTPGKWADMVLVKPLPDSTLELALSHANSAEEALGALFTLAGEESVSEVYVAGSLAYRRAH